eukprot:TRINITY_DN3490_c0_g1_i1.p1 TRINITY_DN3490_c0_g1~~TRINITY_DN3490_c0_g1_i1.p1  ORF type:complete len:330 (+),score=99.43 TRINITY_DN3490_c0_g1_i1:578-1567(+)
MIEGITLEGLIDNRFDVVTHEESAGVSRNRHSDRDLLDAHLATDIEGMTFDNEGFKVQTEEFPWREDCADHWMFKDRAVLASLLSESDCQLIMDKTREHLRPLLLCDGTKRRCNRVAFKNPDLEKLLWDRVRPLLGPIEITDNNKELFLNAGMEGTWEPVGLSGVFRAVQYYGGGHIAPHFDGEWVTDEDTRSIKTILVYMNEGYGEGRTRFLDHRDEDIGVRYITVGGGATRAAEEDVVCTIPVKTGWAAVFDAKMLHEGTTLTTGEKWLLRADILYTCTKRTYPPDSNRGRAIALLNEAEYLEESGRPDLAVRNYRAAYKLCPELEG